MLANLNQPQADAVKTTEGALLVLAGAGTGKTKVLTSRIIHILSCGLANPYEILAVTFTNKAAAEMKRRIGEVVGEQVNNIWVGTFHAICAKILRRHPEIVGLKPDFTIIDDDDQTRLLKQILADFNIDPKQFSPKSYLNKISRLKDGLQINVANGNLVGNLGDNLILPKLPEIFSAYQARLKAMNATDFGDLLVYNLEIFSKSSEVLAYYQNKFRYILVDEYQDTNNAQYQWLLRLSGLYGNICCVGDDDQSIYSWRGANIANILRFEKDFADAKIIRLEQNYRSTSKILRAADAVISNNKQRHGKKLWTEKGEGDKLKLFAFADDRCESAKIANQIQNLLAGKKCPPAEIAVLVRAGYQTRSFEEAFIQNGIPYKVIGGMKFYERMEIRDAIAYLRICANFADDLAMLRIINLPKRGVGESAIASIHIKAKQQQTPLFSAIKFALEEGAIKGKAREALHNLVAILEKFHEAIGQSALSQLAKKLLTDVGYLAMWQSEATIEARGRLENIEEFINSLGDFSTMTEFLEYVSLIEAKDDKNLKEAVSIMTVHGAKGLEFDTVFLPGLEDGVFPSNKSLEERNGIEEERRLLYVAITRAKKNLTLSYAKSRYIFGDMQFSAPSRFLKELPESEIEFEEIGFGEENFFRNNHYSSKAMANNFKNYGSKGDFSNKPNWKNGDESYGSSFATKSWQSAEILKKAVKEQFLDSRIEEKQILSQANKQKAVDYSNQTSSDRKNQADYNANSISGLTGRRIFHQKFGYGKILSVDGNKLNIAFDKAGNKIVMKDFVSLA